MDIPTKQEVKCSRRSSFAQYEMRACVGDVSDSASYTDWEDDETWVKSVSSIDWSFECGESDSVYAAMIRFDCVTFREFALTIGETCTLDEHDCPLELSWTHSPTYSIVPLPPVNFTPGTPRRLSNRERQHRLMESQRSAAPWRSNPTTDGDWSADAVILLSL